MFSCFSFLTEENLLYSVVNDLLDSSCFTADVKKNCLCIYELGCYETPLYLTEINKNLSLEIPDCFLCLEHKYSLYFMGAVPF